jgi:hypothetical protein
MTKQRKYPLLKEVYLSELTKNVSKKYVKKISSKVDKKLYRGLLRLSKIIARLYNNNVTPTDAAQKLKTFISLHPEFNPLKHFDTLGVKMFLHTQEKKSEELGKEKRYYENVIEAFLKDQL